MQAEPQSFNATPGASATLPLGTNYYLPLSAAEITRLRGILLDHQRHPLVKPEFRVVPGSALHY